jgi:hypothetical protein
VREQSGTLPGLQVDWLMGCTGGLRPGKLPLFFPLSILFLFLLFSILDSN